MKASDTDTSATKKVLLVDDYEMVRRGLRNFIEMEPDMDVCAEAASSAEALKQCAAIAPDIALIDLSLGKDSGLELIKDIVVQFPAVKMLVVSSLDEELYAERVLRAGASGFITKDATQAQLIEAIRSVLNGNFYASAIIVQRLIHAIQSPGRPMDPVESLSDRELAVFERIGMGEDAATAAVALSLSVKTVEAYRERIQDKLSLSSSAALVQRAVQWKLANI
jgi:DNA-binding NarL/FixJ family response regulator